MRYLKSFIILSLMISLVLMSGCSAGRRAFSKGESLEAEGRFDEAMYSYAEAFNKDPDVNEYRIRFLKTREVAANLHFKKGSELMDAGNYEGALAEFQSAIGLDPTQTRFRQQVELASRYKDAHLAYQEGLDFEKGNKLKDAGRAFARAVELQPKYKEYLEALNRVMGQRKSKLEGFELSLKSTKPITLKFKDAKLKDVFNIVTQLSGINFIFDETFKDQQVSIYLENATFQQTMDLLTNMHKLGRKVLNEGTVLIYPKTPDKTKQYEDMTLRTFHLNYMDAKKAVNLIRTMLQVRKIYVNEDSNSIVVRDTADIVDVVEKILDANDVPDPEVVLDVEVIEISDKNAQNVGLLLSNYNVQLGAFSPSNQLLSTALSTATTTATTTTTTTNATIDNLVRAFTMKGYGGFVTVPNATYNFGKTLANGEVLSNPKIRVKNKEKSKFTVGTRVPITTSNTTNNTVSVNVQYVDVGVKVNAEPNIQLNNEIVIKLSLEVSSILQKETVGSDKNTTVVTIGTRNLETVLSLKDGETSVIGGLIQKSANNDQTKIFLLGDLPLLGPLISGNNKSRDKTELLLAITPRLVRGVSVPQAGLMSFASGKEDEPSLTRPMASFDLEPVYEAPAKHPAPQSAPKAGDKTSVAPVAPTAAAAVSSPSALAVQASGAVKPADTVIPPAAAARPAAASAQPGQPATAVKPADTLAPPTQSSAVKPAAPPAKRSLLQLSAPASVPVGQQFTIEIKGADMKDLARASFQLTYDPIFVELVSVSEGTYFKKDGKQMTFSSSSDVTAGAITITAGRAAADGGVSGAGQIAVAVFRGKNQGPASFGFRSVALSSTDGKGLDVLPFSTAVDVR